MFSLTASDFVVELLKDKQDKLYMYAITFWYVHNHLWKQNNAFCVHC